MMCMYVYITYTYIGSYRYEDSSFDRKTLDRRSRQSRLFFSVFSMVSRIAHISQMQKRKCSAKTSLTACTAIDADAKYGYFGGRSAPEHKNSTTGTPAFGR